MRGFLLGAEKAAAAITWGASLADNTLTNPDLFSADWGGIGVTPSDSTTLPRWAATVETGGTGCNVAQTCTASDATGTWFRVPAGTTALDVAGAIEKYTSGDANPTFVVRLLSSAGTVRKTVSVTATSASSPTTITLHSVLADGWAAGDELLLQVLCNNAGAGTSTQARGIITTAITTTATGATGVFAAAYQRIAIDSRTISYSLPGRDIATNFGRGPTKSPFSALVFNTNATTFVVDHWSSLVVTDTISTANPFGYTAQNAAMSIYIGAVGAVPAYDQRIDASATTIGIQHATITAAALDGTTKRVELVLGHHAQKSTTNPWTPYTSTARCIYVAKSVTTTVTPGVTTGACLLMVGDSILSGPAFNATDQPTVDAIAMQIRYGLAGVTRFAGRTIVDAMGSHKLEDELTTAGAASTTKADTRAGYWAAVNPTVIWDMLQSNSARDGIDPEIHRTCRFNSANSVHTAMASVMLFDVAAIVRSGYEEGTLSKYREGTWDHSYSTGLTSPGGAGAANHSTWMNWVNGATALGIVIGDLPDGVHISKAKQATYAAAAMTLITAGYVTPPTRTVYQWLGIQFGRIMDGTAAVHSSGGNVTQLDDGGGSALTLVPTGATGPAVNATGWAFDGSQCITTIASRGLKSSATIALGYFASILVGKATTANESFVHNSDTETYTYGTTGNSLQVRRATGGGLTSSKDISANWQNDSAIHSFEHSHDGTHATHKMFKDGTSLGTSNVTVNDVLGTQTTAKVYFFANEANLFGLSGDWKAILLLDHQPAASCRAWFHGYCQTTFGTP